PTVAFALGLPGGRLVGPLPGRRRRPRRAGPAEARPRPAAGGGAVGDRRDRLATRDMTYTKDYAGLSRRADPGHLIRCPATSSPCEVADWRDRSMPPPTPPATTNHHPPPVEDVERDGVWVSAQHSGCPPITVYDWQRRGLLAGRK